MAKKIVKKDQEIVDVVDEDTKILFPILKQKAHAEGQLHKCVIAEIRDSQGRYILVKHSAHKQDPGQYVSPIGGHVRSGESDEEALKREAFEEAGLKDFDFKYIGRFIYNREVIGRKENHYFIVYEITSDLDLILNDEAVEYRRFTKEKLKNALNKNIKAFGDPYLAIVDRYYQYLKT